MFVSINFSVNCLKLKSLLGERGCPNNLWQISNWVFKIHIGSLIVSKSELCLMHEYSTIVERRERVNLNWSLREEKTEKQILYSILIVPNQSIKPHLMWSTNLLLLSLNRIVSGSHWISSLSSREQFCAKPSITWSMCTLLWIRRNHPLAVPSTQIL